jgi:hypothetical protein
MKKKSEKQIKANKKDMKSTKKKGSCNDWTCYGILSPDFR